MYIKFTSVWYEAKVDGLIKSHKSDGREKTSRCKAREFFRRDVLTSMPQ